MRKILYFLVILIMMGLGQLQAAEGFGSASIALSTRGSMLVASPQKPTPDIRISVTKSEISIESSEVIKGITVYDITGKALYSINTSPSRRANLDRSLLPSSPALLLIQITFEGGETSVTKLKV